MQVFMVEGWASLFPCFGVEFFGFQDLGCLGVGL